MLVESKLQEVLPGSVPGTQQAASLLYHLDRGYTRPAQTSAVPPLCSLESFQASHPQL
jgi:hypothetical protein